MLNHLEKTPISPVISSQSLQDHINGFDNSSHRFSDPLKGLKEHILKINSEERVRNLDKFGSLDNVDVFIVVQVHNRLKNLEILVKSLTQAMGIENTLVIFSHDFWDIGMNSFIRNITDLRTLQIFYPFSIQLNPGRFPDTDPRDCPPRHIKKRLQFGSRCLNENWPDTYGNYREAYLAQIKNHWWWKINWLFETSKIGRRFLGDVIFLEEDHYVSEDFLHVFRLLREFRDSKCPSTCNVIALGNYNKRLIPDFSNKVERKLWATGLYNLGYSLNKSAWKVIKNSSDFFCTFDDYNWDLTLSMISHAQNMEMLGILLSRVHHLGPCGVHKKSEECDIVLEVEKLQNLIEKVQYRYYPNSLGLVNLQSVIYEMQPPSGGWGDYRDRELCHAISDQIADEKILRVLQERPPKNRNKCGFNLLCHIFNR